MKGLCLFILTLLPTLAFAQSNEIILFQDDFENANAQPWQISDANPNTNEDSNWTAGNAEPSGASTEFGCDIWHRSLERDLQNGERWEIVAIGPSDSTTAPKHT